MALEATPPGISVQLEIDYPSNDPDGKMPILALKIWVEKSDTGT